MTVLTSILGWQAFGVGVRLYQLKLQGRAISEAPHIYGYVLAGWAAFGYGVYRVELRQEKLLDYYEQRLTKVRETETGAVSSKSQAGVASIGEGAGQPA